MNTESSAVADSLIKEGERRRSQPKRFRFVTTPREPYVDQWGDVRTTESRYEEIATSSSGQAISVADDGNLLSQVFQRPD